MIKMITSDHVCIYIKKKHDNFSPINSSNITEILLLFINGVPYGLRLTLTLKAVKSFSIM